MSDEYKPNKMEQQFLDCVETISVSLKEIKQQLVIKNKIDSTQLVLDLANNKTFSTLNKEQTKASEMQSDRVLVLAGPGTGKTTTLVGRYKYLIDQGIKPEEREMT